jgi:hypothetical protein
MFDILHCTFLRLGDAHRFGPPHLRQIVRKMAVQIATERSRGNTTVTVPVRPEFAESLRAARAAGIIGAEVFTGKLVRGRIVPMNKKAWAAKLKKYAVLAGVNEPKKSCHGGAQGPRRGCRVRRLHREPDDGDVRLDRPKDARALHRAGEPESSESAEWRRSSRSIRASHSMTFCSCRRRTAGERRTGTEW